MALLCFCTHVFSGNFPGSGIQFIENKGQWESHILFRAELPIGSLFIEKNQLTYLFVDKETTHQLEHGKPIKSLHFHSVKVNLLGSNLNPKILKSFQSTEYYNYFVGDQSNWASNVYAYKKIVLQEVYPNTDLELLAQPDGLKINFNLKPGADPNLIQLEYKGADKLDLKENQLKITTSMGEWIEEKPVSFQTLGTVQDVIQTSYVLNKNILSFHLDHYTKKLPLTIDPSVIFGTYVGSAADNFGFAASFDANGNAYGAGTVYAANFPVTTGAYDIVFAGGSSVNGEYARDAFITKFNTNGSQLLFATFIGGTDNEQPHSVTVLADSLPANPEIVIFGTTNSSDFPTTPGAYDRTYNGGSDIFICKLNITGNTMIASTLYGGSGDDGINGTAHYSYSGQISPLPYNYADWYRGEVILDQTGKIYVSSCTQSNSSQNLPMVNSSQYTYGGGYQDGLLLKFTGDLGTLLFSTYVGGNGDDAVYSVCLNNMNDLIIGGGTTSTNMLYGTTNFPFSGSVDGFIGKYSNSGVKQKIIYTGTSSYDQVFFVQTDNQNNIYSMGQSAGLMGMSGNVYGQSLGKQFLQKYDLNLNSILLKTAFGKGGAQPEISPSAFLVDQCGRVYISGWGGGTNNSYHNGMGNVFGLPTTSDAFQKSSYDGSDFYLMVLSQNFAQLSYATFYGGSQSQEHVDGGTSHFDKTGIVYQAVCAGCGGLSDFPTSSNAWSKTNPGKRAYNTNVGGCNLGMFKFDMRTYLTPPVFKDTLLRVIAGTKLQFDFFATDANNDLMSIVANSSFFYRSPNPAYLKDTLSIPGKISARIDWQSLCSDIGMDTQIIYLEFNDNACPVSNTTKGTIRVVVISDPIPPPYPECVKIISDNSVQLKWTNGIPSNDFGKYYILRSKGMAGVKTYDSIPVQTTQTYYDLSAPDNLNTNYCYQMVSLNTCRVFGDSSRKICSLFIDDTLANPVFTGMEETLIQLKAFDTLNKSFFISALEPKDSVFLSVGGNFLTKGSYSITNSLGAAAIIVKWVPGCDDIYKDTLYFYITARDNQCPNWHKRLKVIKIVVGPMDKALAPQIFCPRKLLGDSMEIDWSSFQKQPYTSFIYLIRTENGMNPIQILKTNNLNLQTYIDLLPTNPKIKTCYYITSSDICGYFGDTSKASCSQTEANPAPTLNFYTVTVEENKELKLLWEMAKPDSFWRYQIYKREGRNKNSFNLYKNINQVTDTSFVDKEVQVDKESYCYQIVNVDLCGNKSIVNPNACSIVLSGKSFPFSHTLNWMPYDDWAAGVNRYEILKTEPGLYSEKLFATVSSKSFVHYDNNLNYDNGLYRYTILAWENESGFAQTSRSNTIELIQAPWLYTPNAYTENGDGLNDSFRTVPVFVKDFYLQIYNRWGERIFETYNKKEGFSSMLKNEEIQSDVYFYIVSYTGWDGSAQIKKGNITLLR